MTGETMQFPAAYKITLSEQGAITWLSDDVAADARDVIVATFIATSRAHARAVAMAYMWSLTDDDIAALRLAEQEAAC